MQFWVVWEYNSNIWWPRAVCICKFKTNKQTNTTTEYSLHLNLQKSLPWRYISTHQAVQNTGEVLRLRNKEKSPETDLDLELCPDYYRDDEWPVLGFTEDMRRMPLMHTRADRFNFRKRMIQMLVSEDAKAEQRERQVPKQTF